MEPEVWGRCSASVSMHTGRRRTRSSSSSCYISCASCSRLLLLVNLRLGMPSPRLTQRCHAVPHTRVNSARRRHVCHGAPTAWPHAAPEEKALCLGKIMQILLALWSCMSLNERSQLSQMHGTQIFLGQPRYASSWEHEKLGRCFTEDKRKRGFFWTAPGGD